MLPKFKDPNCDPDKVAACVAEIQAHVDAAGGLLNLLTNNGEAMAFDVVAVTESRRTVINEEGEI
jgi:hypothetical protein